MEIHVPSGRPHSWKNFAIELGTITTGILIALTLEALVEQRHYRVLADEARETITSEIKDNAQELQSVLKQITESGRSIEAARIVVEELLATRKSNATEFSLDAHMAELSSSSWQTAQHTGALSHMPYSEVQTFSKVYSMQDLFLDHQRRSFERLASALSLLRAGGDPHKTPPEDLRALRTQILEHQANVFLQQKLGEGLLKAYQKILEK